MTLLTSLYGSQSSGTAFDIFDQGRISGFQQWGFNTGSQWTGITVKEWSADQQTLPLNPMQWGTNSITQTCTSFTLSSNEYINGFRVLYSSSQINYLGFHTSNNNQYICNYLSFGTDTGWIIPGNVYLTGFAIRAGAILDGIQFQFANIPTSDPTNDPTTNPSISPTSSAPTNDPTSDPTNDPTTNPSISPTTAAPTSSVPTTAAPTSSVPTIMPSTTTVIPTTALPTTDPPTTALPTVIIATSTISPTMHPSSVPTIHPGSQIKETSTTMISSTNEPLGNASDNYQLMFLLIAIAGVLFVVILILSICLCIKKQRTIRKDTTEMMVKENSILELGRNVNNVQQPNGEILNDPKQDNDVIAIMHKNMNKENSVEYIHNDGEREGDNKEVISPRDLCNFLDDDDSDDSMYRGSNKETDAGTSGMQSKVSRVSNNGLTESGDV